MNNRVEQLYTSRATRIYFVDHAGKVFYNPGIGPFGFNPDHLEPAIERYLSETHEGDQT